MIMGDEMITELESDDEHSKTDPDELPVSSSGSNSSLVKKNRARLTFPFGACRVCSDSATGIHYGIATCEGCKGFFKRSILRKEKYRCYFDNSCHINVTNRNRCKACRFHRCLTEGMSVDGVKMGRIPKLVKERALREQKEQQMQREAALAETHDQSEEGRPRESSYSSSSSDRSVENYDPDTMETGMMKLPLSGFRRQLDFSKTYADKHDHELYLSTDRRMSQPIVEPHLVAANLTATGKALPVTSTNGNLRFLPTDFTIDETVGLTERVTEPLSEEIFQYIRSISAKLSENQSNLSLRLTENESKFIGYLRWSSHNVFLRHSIRVKQLEARMHRMLDEDIDVCLDDTASIEQFVATLPKTLEMIIRSSVFYVQELPGLANIGSSNLHKMILHRAFDWFLLKYNSLLHENGQCYFLALDGFSYTRRWINFFYGIDMAHDMFQFSQHMRDLNLTDREMALILPLQICSPDATMEDQEIQRMLRSCYLYALFEELRHNRGEQEGTLVCSRILQILDLLIPLTESYEKNVATRIVPT